jgi:putative hydrolase of the HAD superfamily
MVVVFDLDDTLYDEGTYVASGFRAVSQFIAARHGHTPEHVFKDLESALVRHGRGKVFDVVLSGLGCDSAREVARCVAVYRRHRPEIALWPAADACLARLADQVPCYVVTDGNKRVQWGKLKALGLLSRVKRCMPTHQYGIQHAKPSPWCFMKIAAMERVSPRDVVYVGDNPRKDFVGLKPLGFRTVRVRTGALRLEGADARHEAEVSIPSLEVLDLAFLESLGQREGEVTW